MKNSQSKFSNDKFKSSSSQPGSTSASGCCCGANHTDDSEEVDIVDIEEN